MDAIKIRKATMDDLPRIVKLMADDMLGSWVKIIANQIQIGARQCEFKNVP